MEIGRPDLKTFYILQILMERTDEEHALNAAALGEILEREYGIRLNRQTIYSEIEKLERADIDVESRRKKSWIHRYCVPLESSRS